jgi:hypothetical protein
MMMIGRILSSSTAAAAAAAAAAAVFQDPWLETQVKLHSIRQTSEFSRHATYFPSHSAIRMLHV